MVFRNDPGYNRRKNKEDAMDFKELNYVLAIARHQNITKAAEALHLTQPTLSKFLKALETELHQPLFQRLMYYPSARRSRLRLLTSTKTTERSA